MWVPTRSPQGRTRRASILGCPPRACPEENSAMTPSSRSHLPFPLTQAPATSLDGECSNVPRSRSESMDRPTHGLVDVVRGYQKGCRTLLGIACQGNRETPERQRETAATGLHVSLLLRPTTEEGLGEEMVGKNTQLPDFRCREEVPRELRVIRLRPDVFEIDADVGLSGDGDEGKTGGVREVELEPAAEPGAEVRLAECLVHKAYSARFGLEIVPQEISQHTVRDDEMPTIALESETCAPVAFFNREGRV